MHGCSKIGLIIGIATIKIAMIPCRIAALEAPGRFSLSDCIDKNFLQQATLGVMIWQVDPTYEILELLGCGTYGTVCRGRNIATGRVVAIKRIYMAQEVCMPKRVRVLVSKIPDCIFSGYSFHAIRTQRVAPNPS
jgi:serine/threonine protein kinase